MDDEDTSAGGGGGLTGAAKERLLSLQQQISPLASSNTASSSTNLAASGNSQQQQQQQSASEASLSILQALYIATKRKASFALSVDQDAQPAASPNATSQLSTSAPSNSGVVAPATPTLGHKLAALNGNNNSSSSSELTATHRSSQLTRKASTNVYGSVINLANCPHGKLCVRVMYDANTHVLTVCVIQTNKMLSAELLATYHRFHLKLTVSATQHHTKQQQQQQQQQQQSRTGSSRRTAPAASNSNTTASPAAVNAATQPTNMPTYHIDVRKETHTYEFIDINQNFYFPNIYKGMH